MQLIGQYDSPFTRRVGIVLQRYALAFVHSPLSVWADAEQLARYNPLRRVPTLVLDDGTALVESWAILDVLDEWVGPERALLPARGPVRQEGMRISALGSGLADKAVSLFYEPLLRDSPSRIWIERCHTQIRDTLDRLESERAGRATDFWLGDSLSHADIAVACALRFTDEAHPGLFDPQRWPHLAAHSRRCEALPEFVAISQPILVNVGKGDSAGQGETGGA